MRTHDQPYATLYEQWLDDTYGKTELGKMWEYLSTIDGIQALLMVGGFVCDWCDVINCVIYLCRGKYEEAIWSAVGAIPLWGSLIGKGGRKAVSLAGDLAEVSQTMKLASEGSQAIRKLSLVLEVPADLLLDFDKAMSHFADQLRAAMMAPEYNRLYLAGIEYVNDVEIFYRMTDGAVDGMQSAWRLESNLVEEAADVWKVPEEGGNNTDAFDYYMDMVETLDVSTKPNSAVFYSGPGNRALAEEFARKNGKMTLESTTGGAYLDGLNLFGENSPLTREEAANVWARLSARYAQNASGNTYGFVNGSSLESIFNTVEYPELLKNPNVTNIFTEFMN